MPLHIEKKRNKLCKDGYIYNINNNICDQYEDSGCNQIGSLMCNLGLSMSKGKYVELTFY